MKEILHSLGTMYKIERAATAIYKAQVPAFRGNAIADKLRAATANEQEHADNLRARIEELGGSTPRSGFIFQMGGMFLGFATIFSGRIRLLKTNCWVERKAVKDYSGFLQRVDFDEKSVAVIQKNIGDEKRHLKTWEKSIQILKNQN